MGSNKSSAIGKIIDYYKSTVEDFEEISVLDVVSRRSMVGTI